jgi:tRNA-2-methylthio-N6-dimethylallyladenosine synthase
MPDQIDERIKAQRNHDLLSVVDASARRSSEKMVGREVEILCEGSSRTNAARLMGRTRTNKIVVFKGDDALVGKMVNIRIERSNGFSLYGTPSV